MQNTLKIESYLEIQQYTNQRRWLIEDSISDKQRIIQTKSNILWTIQLVWNISIDNEQYIPRIIT